MTKQRYFRFTNGVEVNHFVTDDNGVHTNAIDTPLGLIPVNISFEARGQMLNYIKTKLGVTADVCDEGFIDQIPYHNGYHLITYCKPVSKDCTGLQITYGGSTIFKEVVNIPFANVKALRNKAVEVGNRIHW